MQLCTRVFLSAAVGGSSVLLLSAVHTPLVVVWSCIELLYVAVSCCAVRGCDTQLRSCELACAAVGGSSLLLLGAVARTVVCCDMLVWIVE